MIGNFNFEGRITAVQVKVVQCFWNRVIDRSKLSHLLRTLPRETQITLGHKLGWKTVYNPHSPDLAYVLDLSRPDDNEVGTRLFRAGVDIRGRNVNNLLIAGVYQCLFFQN